MTSLAERELAGRGLPLAAAKLVELHPDQSVAAVTAWDALYVSSRGYDIKQHADLCSEGKDSTTLLGSGTFCEVHLDLKRPDTHVVMVATYSFDGATDRDSDDAATYGHYANTLDAAVRIRAASMPDREPKWAAVPSGFTLVTDDDERVYFVFFMLRCTPLLKHPDFLNRQSYPGPLRKLMRSLATSAWFIENVVGLAHRDIKPANVLVTREGRAVLADFGSARPIGSFGNPSFYMNPPWMNPEELDAIDSLEEYHWNRECSAFAVGLIMLWACWGETKFKLTFKQHAPKSGNWIRKVVFERTEGYYKHHRVLLNKVPATRASFLERAALMLANPVLKERATLAYIEHALRPLPSSDPAAFLELPEALQRTGEALL